MKDVFVRCGAGAILAAMASGTTGCVSSETTPYVAEIRRTTYGVPHVRAADVGSLGFGQGYAVAQDHVCTIADQVIRVRSQRAKYFGEGEGGAHVDDDFALLALDIRGTARAGVETLPQDARELLAGFVAGYNAYLADTPPSQRPSACRDKEWVTPIDEIDVLARGVDVALVGFERIMLRAIARAQPPSPATAAASEASSDATIDDLPLLVEGSHEVEAASNGWGIGRDRAEDGHGMLLANPHFPWEGELRFHEIHLTIPSKLDVYGAGLLGMPGVAIGFNDDVAWTATASASSRSTLYKLKLVPGDPTSYVLDGVRRPMDRRELTVDVLRDGHLVPEKRVVYRSVQGPIIALPGVGWTSDVATAIRSAGANDTSLVTTWSRMMSARDVSEIDAANAGRGIPWANTIASDRAGDTLYVDASRVPSLSRATLDEWSARLASDPMTAKMWAHKIVLLDGSVSDSAWQEGGTYPFLVPISQAPRLARTDFVFNANDSFWMTNPSSPIRGVSPLYGAVDKPLSARTRMNARLLMDRAADGPAGKDGRFSIDELEQAVTNNEGLVTDLLKGPLVERCSASNGAPERVREACRILGSWDGRDNLGRAGAVLWREVLGALEERGGLFADAFDTRSPVDTPRVLVAATSSEPDPIVRALTTAIERLDRAGIPIDAPLDAVQYVAGRSSRIPVPGCSDLEGCLDVVGFTDRLTTSLLPASKRVGESSDTTGLGRDGYPINYGSSFVLSVKLGGGAPRADAVLVYGENEEPSSKHSDDQAQVWAQGHLRPVLFDEVEIAKATEARMTVRGPRAAAR